MTGALVHLQIGRAYAVAGESAKAKSTCKDFLTLWKDADPDFPILKEAKAAFPRSEMLAQSGRVDKNGYKQSS